LNRQAGKILAAAERAERELSTEEWASLERLRLDVKAIESDLWKDLHAVDYSREFRPAKAAKWNGLGEFVGAVVQAGVWGANSSQNDTRLVYQAGFPTGQGERNAADGGYLLDGQLAISLMEQIYGASMLAPLCRTTNLPMNFSSLKVAMIDETGRANGARNGGMQAFWRSEADAIDSTKLKFKQNYMHLQSLSVITQLTDELREDVPGVDEEIGRMAAEEFGFALDSCIVRGTGAGQPKGFLGAPGTIVVPKESGQAAATIVAANVKKMYARMVPAGYRRCVWLAHKDCLPQLMSFTDPSLEVRVNGDQLTLLGRPLLVSEHASALGTEGDLTLCDPLGYRIVRRATAKAVDSIHVKFNAQESLLRFTLRLNGQPIRTTPVTTLNSSETVSEFVVLATRA
jgi:HK97 family phage major capsid protein